MNNRNLLRIKLHNLARALSYCGWRFKYSNEIAIATFWIVQAQSQPLPDQSWVKVCRSCSHRLTLTVQYGWRMVRITL
jgi:hypothetical protein